MMVVTYEALNDGAFAKKLKELKVGETSRGCRGFTTYPTETFSELMLPHQLSQVFVRSTQTRDDLHATYIHETIHVLQYLCGAERTEPSAYLLETIVHQVLGK